MRPGVPRTRASPTRVRLFLSDIRRNGKPAAFDGGVRERSTLAISRYADEPIAFDAVEHGAHRRTPWCRAGEIDKDASTGRSVRDAEAWGPSSAAGSLA